MFLHLGNEKMVPLRDIIAIINLTDTDLELNREFLQTAQDEGFVVELTSEPVSCVITEKTVYLSPISSDTLKKRALKPLGDM